jgi:hypothetical protein
MANKISGIDGRPVQVGGGAPVSRVRDTTDGRKADTTGSSSNVDVSDTARTLAVLEEKIADVPVVNEARVERCVARGRRLPSRRRPAGRRQDALRRRPARRQPGLRRPAPRPIETRMHTERANLTRDHLARLLADENPRSPN